MKLHNSVGPNPKVVRMFMAERGLEINLEEVDLMGGENRQEAYLKVNPAGQLPALELDNGDVITEITAICEYLDEKEGSSSLIGTSPEERGETLMWVRRIDHCVMANLANGFR
ncbi:MAG: glutathione S-transferase, partial [Chloroflexi bacterium]|nr:glutathione S-transferase [Chloroflexota bacterium]